MNQSRNVRAPYKAQARLLREALAAQGRPISHAQALELVARQHGARDWNTLCAGLRPDPPQVGDAVTGRYLGQRFAGRLKSLDRMAHGDGWRVTVDLDEAIDVVSFSSFSSWRKRITGTVGADGRSAERRSDGTPHLVLDWALA